MALEDSLSSVKQLLSNSVTIYYDYAMGDALADYNAFLDEYINSTVNELKDLYSKLETGISQLSVDLMEGSGRSGAY